MPYYYITIIAKGRKYGGVKFDHLTDIDTYAQKAWRAVLTHLRCEPSFFEVVMLTSQAPAVLEYLEKRRNNPPPYTGTPTNPNHIKEKYAYRPENMNHNKQSTL